MAISVIVWFVIWIDFSFASRNKLCLDPVNDWPSGTYTSATPRIFSLDYWMILIPNSRLNVLVWSSRQLFLEFLKVLALSILFFVMESQQTLLLRFLMTSSSSIIAVSEIQDFIAWFTINKMSFELAIFDAIKSRLCFIFYNQRCQSYRCWININKLAEKFPFRLSFFFALRHGVNNSPSMKFTARNALLISRIVGDFGQMLILMISKMNFNLRKTMSFCRFHTSVNSKCILFDYTE